MKDIEKLNWVSWLLIILSIVFVVGSFFVPYIFTHFSNIDITETGQIGDTIGGIMNPFISIAGVAMMFLAFYMQYNANKLQRRLFDEQIQTEKQQFQQNIDEQRKQFERDQFENQFFEMLKIHRENSNNIANSYERNRKNDGTINVSGYATTFEWSPTRKKINGFEYLVGNILPHYTHHKNDKTFRDVYTKFVWEDSFGHYFRHLFLLVKFVVSKEFLSYEEKRAYLRILRASLSTYEQIFLYYNWLSDYGSQWENDKNHFFTDYRMIHNIVPDKIIPDFSICNMTPFKELLETKNYRTEEGKNSADDPLFEFEDQK